MIYRSFFLVLSLLMVTSTAAQNLLLGADLSYVNEMEDCGAVFKENQVEKDPYLIFADHGCEVVRLRLWHSPAWYDVLNDGKRYSDFADVRRSIQRARAAGMKVLLDFHLSDNWADPSKQLIPQAWLGVVDNLPLLKDSLYNYISGSLTALAAEGLLPEWVQIGNETNKGILLSPADNAVWTLDWSRNAQLFNTAIQAVRDVEQSSGRKIDVALHIAGPADVEWLLTAFLNNGVTDFEVVGISYYWQWHQPVTIDGAAEVVGRIRQNHPDKQVMIMETGYPWTLSNHDAANNILSDTFTGFSPASPQNQQAWLVELTKAVAESGAAAVLYWEPAWVSTPCSTQWGMGSHGENATFFDFNNNLVEEGGISWMSYDYSPSAIGTPDSRHPQIRHQLIGGELLLRIPEEWRDQEVALVIVNAAGQEFSNSRLLLSEAVHRIPVASLPTGNYVMSIVADQKWRQTIRWRMGQ